MPSSMLLKFCVLLSCFSSCITGPGARHYSAAFDEFSQVFNSNHSPHVLSETAHYLAPFMNRLNIYQVPFVESFDSIYFPAAKVFSSCFKDLELVAKAVTNGDQLSRFWGLNMLDAAGKPPPGILLGNFKFIGQFSQCRDLVSPTEIVINGSKSSRGNITSTYCWIGANAVLGKSPVQLRLDACVPDSCASADLLQLYQLLGEFVRSKYNLTLPPADSTASACATYFSDKKLDSKAIGVLAFCGVYAFLLFSATLFDIILGFLNAPPHQSRWPVVVNADPEDSQTMAMEAPLVAPPLLFPGQSCARGNLGTGSSLFHVEFTLYAVRQLNIISRLVLCFSVRRNAERLLSTSKVSGQLDCVHGVRLLSMFWVILGHAFFFPLAGGGVDNIALAMNIVKRWSMGAIVNATVSVDTFFLLSGLLLTYLLLNELDTVEGGPRKFNWAMFYFHRFWRLTPVYMILLVINYCLSPYFGEGPFFPDNLDPNCGKNWWTNLLYVNNLVRANESCFGWAWYLANDMQFHVISPFFILALWFWPAIGLSLLALFWLFCTTATGMWSAQNSLAVTLASLENPNFNFMTEFYILPWVRIGAYLIGIGYGYLLHRGKLQHRMNWVFWLLGWIFAAFLCLSVLYGPYRAWNGHPFSTPVAALYNCTSRSAWVLGVGWVVFACLNGRGFFVNTLLSWRGLVPLSRLTYCAYLVHPIVIMVYLANLERLSHWSDMTMILYFLGFLTASYAIAFCASLAFESPMMALEKVIFTRRPTFS